MAAQIVIDARKLGDGGIGVYLENLIDGLISLRRTGELVATLCLLIQPRDQYESVEVSNLIDEWNGEVEIVEERAGKYSPSEYFLLARNQKRLLKGSHLFHSVHYTLPYFLKIPSMVTIHDCIHVTDSQSFLRKLIGGILIKSAVARASAIVTVSQHSASVLKRLFPVSKSKTLVVVPNAGQAAISNQGEALKAAASSKRYCLFVGNSKPHKGLSRVLETWQILEKRLKSEDLPNLVIAGSGLTERDCEKVAELEYAMAIGRCSVKELSKLYNSAACVVMASTEEGFGIPALEALTCGVPLASFPTPSIEEYFGEAAWISRDFSAATLAETLVNLFNNEDEREKKIELGLEISKQFTRERIARETAAVYEAVIKGNYTETAPRVFSDKVRESLGRRVV